MAIRGLSALGKSVHEVRTGIKQNFILKREEGFLRPLGFPTLDSAPLIRSARESRHGSIEEKAWSPVPRPVGSGTEWGYGARVGEVPLRPEPAGDRPDRENPPCRRCLHPPLLRRSRHCFRLLRRLFATTFA